jgi:hypothetical protein
MRILLIGDTQRREFREAGRMASAWGEVVEAPDVASARVALADTERDFDWIVLATSYPGQYSEEQIDSLRRLAPLSRVVALLGSWCEGEARSGRPVAGVIRVYWHQWEQRLGWEAVRWSRGARSTWALPITAQEEERVLALAADGIVPRSGSIAVCSEDFACAEWLCASCRKAGYEAQWFRPADPLPNAKFTVGIFDTGEECGRYDDLRRFATALRPSPVTALIAFPRIEDREQALAAGAASLLSKPVWMEDLLWEIDRLATDPSPRSRLTR